MRSRSCEPFNKSGNGKLKLQGEMSFTLHASCNYDINTCQAEELSSRN